LVIAHRGASAQALENSLAAFRRAVDLGADGIELDVHATLDGALLVHHDPVIDGAAISSLTLSDARQHRLANGERPPTLAEALEAAGPTLTVCIEVKALDARYDATLFGQIDAAPAPKHCQVHSFDHRIIRRLSGQRPAVTYGVLSTSYPLDPVEQITQAGARTLWEEASMIDQPLVTLVHQAGAHVIAWTVDDPARARGLAAMGVDGLCTNTPDLIRKALA
jgi:glycerophosphoryl diester phosphodiesterase